jgi:hypothetical protein
MNGSMHSGVRGRLDDGGRLQWDNHFGHPDENPSGWRKTQRVFPTTSYCIISLYIK